MKLFLIIYVGAKVGGAIGPLPYDMTECIVRADEHNADLAAAIERHVDLAIPTPRDAALMDFRCELHAQRPALDGQ